MTTPMKLDEILAALEEAATEEQPMRIGHEVARTLHAALTDAMAPGPHVHLWVPLGYDRVDGTAMVVMACGCGEAREVTP